ncbi:hypothetical protein M6D81_05315 [Paenibacillus sp. J5C_2022]|nr:hypothetical protein [Paenibacillus sp. J5C2022]
MLITKIPMLNYANPLFFKVLMKYIDRVLSETPEVEHGRNTHPQTSDEHLDEVERKIGFMWYELSHMTVLSPPPKNKKHKKIG